MRVAHVEDWWVAAGWPARPAEVLGKNVRDYRLARGLKQEALASRLCEWGFKTQQTTVTRIENASRPVPVDEVAALAAVLGVTVGDLISPSRVDITRVEAIMHALRRAEREARRQDALAEGARRQVERLRRLLAEVPAAEAPEVAGVV